MVPPVHLLFTMLYQPHHNTIEHPLHDGNATRSNINNRGTEPFGLHRGFCQGCPLAPYLFIIMTEALNAAVKHAMGTDNLKGITLPQSDSQLIINQYVDDTSFIVKA